MSDVAYMDAVQRGDIAAAQRMVDAAANAAGYTIGPVYHGSTHKFTVFLRNRSNIENDFGAGYYFSSSLNDVESNYAGEGPDLTSRIEKLSEQLESNEGLDPDEARARAVQELVGESKGGRVIAAFIKMKNPAVIGGKKPTRLSEESDEDSGESTGTAVEFLNALRDVSSEFDDANSDDAVENIYSQFGSLDGVEIGKVIEFLKSNESIGFATDPDSGDLASNEIIRKTLESMGFDGIIDFTVNKKFGSERRVGKRMMGLDPNTFHVIAFESNQIKSADPVTYDDSGNVIPLSRRFDSQSPDIRNPRTRSLKQFPYEYAAYLKANFPDIWRAGGNIRGNDTFRWWTAYRKGDRSKKVVYWWETMRPAWIARHFNDHRLPGVIAQIKWGAVGKLGVAGMKRVVEDAIRKRYA